jgi:hypothetical protein
MGTIDKVIRVFVALAIIVLYAKNLLFGTVAISLLMISLILILTSFVSFCPLYKILGINTCDRKGRGHN